MPENKCERCLRMKLRYAKGLCMSCYQYLNICKHTGTKPRIMREDTYNKNYCNVSKIQSKEVKQNGNN